MTEEHQHDTTDKLVHAYEQMLKQTHETIEKAQKESVPKFREMLDKARDNMVELGELTREEAEKVSDYIKRDIEDAANYIAETGQEMRDWWRFDLELIERRMMDMFTQVADQTSLQLAQWAENARRMSLYQAGEVTGPGTLICDRCGAETHFVKAGRIPICAECGGTSFRRRTEDADKTA
ncbi:zinc ribbon-containing protein [uncultured Thiocystis sp.]|jgi:polyhydroxyalkanoate synthesis regulator phasin/ribosomal protein L37E|uniref:zinc ribbon-containing protein n=1 Tax=uncultured Thiocystis sp. TaxID=1202134 RepID=UPI0025F5624B|nr:zinc ribbon-containing protein [uncultured Thiocystis sp.]